MANASKKTEEEMLQETFQNFKTQADTEEPATESPSGNGGGSGGKNKKNMVPLFVVGGLVATGIVGYVAVVKPMLQPNPVMVAQDQNQQPQVGLESSNQAIQQPTNPIDQMAQLNANQAPTTVVPQTPSLESFQVEVAATPSYTPPVQVTPVPVAPEPAPVQVAPVPVAPEPAPVQVAPVPVAPEPAPVQVTPVPVAPEPAPVQVAPVAVTPEPAPVQVAPVAVTPEPAPVQVAPVAVNNTSDVVVSDLVAKFDNQTNEFKSLIGGLDTRVTVLEGKFAEQDGVNKVFDERITALEKGKVDKKGVNASKSASSSSSTASKDVSSEEKKVKTQSTKKGSTPKKISEERVEKKTIVDDGSILVDKNGGKRVKPKQPEAPKPVAKKEVLQPLKIHSIYGSRMWVTNPNGTLSTYSEGNVLPTGEVIKEIDDATFTIVTNKRTIVKE